MRQIVSSIAILLFAVPVLALVLRGVAKRSPGYVRD
jgi:hypothetical protein